VSSIFDEIRARCSDVAASADHVRIDEEGLEGFADRLDLDIPDDDPGHERVGDDESAAAFVITLDAINFGSGYFPYIRKRPGHSGYHTITASLRDHIDLTGPPTSQWLQGISADDCAAIFDQSLDEPWPAELMGYFSSALRDLGAFVDRVGGGRFLGVLDAAGHRASRLIELLDEMPCYHDVHRHRGAEVPLYKRAQITAFDIAAVFDDTGPGVFHDLDQLTMFADNLVPHVLRVEGVLRFSDELVARIEAADDITVGSEPEVEIRACGLHTVELLVARLAERGEPTTAGHLDGVLWRMGGNDRYKAVPRHRSRCVYY
jgi:hypothetical protein